MAGSARARLWGVALVLVLLAGCREKERPPNIVVLVMDTTRADRCSFVGYDRATTPELGSLAAEATVYRDAWTPSPWTGPAHASLFTGLRPEHHGFLAGVRMNLRANADTLAERLAAAGYRTFGVTNNVFVTAEFGLAQGFEEMRCCEDPGGPGRSDTEWAHGEARRFVTEAMKEDRPFFLFVNDMDPHLPYDPDAASTAKFLREPAPPEETAWARNFDALEPISFTLGRLPVGPGKWRLLSDLYDAEIYALDGAIGRLARWLRDRGVLDRTVLVVAGDHGENLGDHGLASHDFDVHRTLLHVPLLIRFPSRFAGGAVVGDPVRLEDVYPTLLSLAGVEPGPGLDGESLLGGASGRVCRAVLGPPPAPKFERDFPGFSKTPFSRSIRSAYDGRYHLVAWSDGEERLYDVKADPAEERDLAKGEPEVLARLRSLLP